MFLLSEPCLIASVSSKCVSFLSSQVPPAYALLKDRDPDLYRDGPLHPDVLRLGVKRLADNVAWPPPSGQRKR